MLRRCISLFLLAGFLSGGLAASAAARVVIISPHNEAIRNEFGAGFAMWHREKFGEEAVVEWRDVGGTTDALRFVQSEFAKKPGGIGIDMFFGGGPEPYLLLADKGFAAAYQPPDEILRGIPQNHGGVEIYDAKFKWFGAALSTFGILQNTKVQRMTGLPFATSWEDLADPRLYGSVGAGDPRKSGTMNTMFETLLQFYGWERGWSLLARIGGNVRRFDMFSSATAKDVTLGETTYGLAIDFYGFTQIAAAGKTNLAFTLPKDFIALNADGIAILQGAPNMGTARRFIDFTMGEPGQKLWFLQTGRPGGATKEAIDRMCVRPDFYERFRDESNIQYSPFAVTNTFGYDSKLARERRDVVAALIGALLVDTHPELRKAWKAAMPLKGDGDQWKPLGTVPITEAEALRLAKNEWKEPAVRNRLKIQWQTWAQEKYKRIAAGD